MTVQAGDVHVVGDGQDPVGAPSASGDRVPSQSHHIEPAPSTQVTATSTPKPISQSPDVVSQMSNIIGHVGKQVADSRVCTPQPST